MGLELVKEALKDIVDGVYAEEVLSGIVQTLKERFKPRSCGVVLQEEEGLRVKISRGLSYTFIKELHSQTTHPLLEELKKEKKTVVIDEKHHLYPVKLEHPYKKLVLVPLFRGESVKGMLFLNISDDRDITGEDLSLLETVGYLISVVLRHYELEDKLSELNNHDTLTGVYNYKRFHELLFQEVIRSQDTDHSFSIILFAITGLKRFNELYGHIKGDELLKSTARLIEKHARRFDYVARYAAAKFALLMPEAGKEIARRLAEEVLEEFKQSQWAKDVYLDIGVVTFPEDAQDEKTLLNRLEECVHEGKRDNNHSIVVWKS